MRYQDFLNRVRSTRKENEFKRYNDVLTEEEIYQIGQAIQELKLKEITYIDFKNKIESMNFIMDPIIEEKATKNPQFLEREASNDYLSTDIRGLLLTNNKYENIIVYYELPMLKVLAKYKDKQVFDRVSDLQKNYYNNSSEYIRTKKR